MLALRATKASAASITQGYSYPLASHVPTKTTVPLTQLQLALIALREASPPDDAALRGQIESLATAAERRVEASKRVAELLNQLEWQARQLEARASSTDISVRFS